MTSDLSPIPLKAKKQRAIGFKLRAGAKNLHLAHVTSSIHRTSPFYFLAAFEPGVAK